MQNSQYSEICQIKYLIDLNVIDDLHFLVLIYFKTSDWIFGLFHSLIYLFIYLFTI